MLSVMDPYHHKIFVHHYHGRLGVMDEGHWVLGLDMRGVRDAECNGFLPS